GGTTGITNLESLCRKHHRLKHTSGWAPTKAGRDEPPGWISPTGRHYGCEHQDWEPPQWPAQILDQLRHREIGPASPEDSLPGQPPPEDSLPGQPPPEDPMPEDPLPTGPSRPKVPHRSR
ncbi:MAG TPA: endonuclease, partial [Arthrobacter sp.]